MTDAYAYVRARVAETLAVWKTGTVTLTRSTPGTPDPETPWTPGAPTLDVFTLDARVDGVSDDDLKDTSVVSTDLVLIASPKATNAGGAIVDIDPQMSDIVTIDGAAKVIKKIEAVPAAGPAARFHIFVAS
jgi:hypothetical protein